MGFNKTFFKANRLNKGSLLNIGTGFINRNNGKPEYNLFLKIVKQNGWNEKNLTGSFRGGEEVITKLDDVEVATFIRAFRLGIGLEKGFYHKTQSGGTQINLRLSKVETVDKTGEKIAKPRFFQAKKIEYGDDFDYFYSLLVSKDSNEFKFTLSLEEAELLRIFLENSLNEFFNYEKRHTEKQVNRKPTSPESRYVEEGGGDGGGKQAQGASNFKQPSVNKTFDNFEQENYGDDDDIPF